MLILTIIENWHTGSIDFTLAFPQAELEHEIYMELPAGMQTAGATRKSHVLQLRRNLYGLKDAGYTWSKKLFTGQEDRGFVPSKIDPCVFIKDGIVVLIYVDDCLVFAKKEADVKGSL